uniref:Ig-like domain-containing protein n=1 Tax=Salmo trutta TaxID=8032 RepID=A0A674D0K5_SALTR
MVLFCLFLWTAFCLLLMVTAEELKVRQWPPSLTVMQGQSANLSCRFEATSYGVDWFKIEGAEKIPIPDSAGQTSLVITEVSVEDAGVYYCEVNVLHRDPERGGGTKLIVLEINTSAFILGMSYCNALEFLVIFSVFVGVVVIVSHMYPLRICLNPNGLQGGY